MRLAGPALLPPLLGCALLGWAVLAGGGVLLGCTTLLGLDDREDAVAALCQCEAQLPRFDDCRATLTRRLELAAPATRAAWLEHYANSCQQSCEPAYSCYAQPGTCAQLSCTSDEECCGYGAPTNEAALCDLASTAPTCISCSNTSCSSDMDCCAFRRDEGFCNTASGMCSSL